LHKEQIQAGWRTNPQHFIGQIVGLNPLDEQRTLVLGIFQQNIKLFLSITRSQAGWTGPLDCDYNLHPINSIA